MRLAVILFLSALPFLGMAWLVWIGPRNSWSARYRQAIDHHVAAVEAAEQLNARLGEEGDRLGESQRRLVERQAARVETIGTRKVVGDIPEPGGGDPRVSPDRAAGGRPPFISSNARRSQGDHR